MKYAPLVQQTGLTVPQITKDLMNPRYAFPKVVNLIALWMIAINPITKFGLASRPVRLFSESS